MAVGLHSREVKGGLSCVSCLSLASSDIFMLERVEESSGLYWDTVLYYTAVFVCVLGVGAQYWVLSTGVRLQPTAQLG